MAQLIHEYATHIRTEGPVFAVRTYREERQDGTYIGWLEFKPPDHGVPGLRTERDWRVLFRRAT